MARIKGVDIPNDKHICISLTYIYGIGRSLAKQILSNVGIEPTTKTKDLYVTTITDFESYTYSKELVQKIIDEKEDTFEIDGIPLNSYFNGDNEGEITLSSQKNKIVPRKTIIEESKVHESNLFFEEE